ncbi:MAG: 30S ribosomal protein S4e [Candidatus Wukongarchaeota archaeon]|nr:30S ribosomal protein S4e [Candidatus Wukongarchaeota archaeon]
MGRKGNRQHMKRLAAPRLWPVHRKKAVWAVKPSPGPHPMGECLPLQVIIRDILDYAKTGKEAKKIITDGKIIVDGRVRKDRRFPVGLMDVIEIPDLEELYRVLPKYRKGLVLQPIEAEEKNFKLCKVIGKTTIKGGKTQFNLYDGRNLVLVEGRDYSEEEEESETEIISFNDIKVNDVLKISIPNQKFEEYIKLEEGVIGLIVGGKNAGRFGVIKDITKGLMRSLNLITIETETEPIMTPLDFVFVVGKETPLIKLPDW